MLPAVKFTHVIDAENMRMIERRRHLRFALKSPASRRIRQVVGEELDRDRAVEPAVDSPKHNAHPSGADSVLEPVLAKLYARAWKRCGEQFRLAFPSRAVEQVRAGRLRQHGLDFLT